VEPADPTTRELRAVIRDLVALATIPAGWLGREPSHIAENAANLILHTLRADAAYVCIVHGEQSLEIERAKNHHGFAQQLRRLCPTGILNAPIVDSLEHSDWPAPLRVSLQPIGISGESGFIAAGCSSPTFPSETDNLLLSVTANQLAVAMQTARLLDARRQSERLARESEERFRAIVDTTPECVKLVARDGTLVHMNSAGLALLGIERPEVLVGRNIYDVIAPEDRTRFRDFNERICDGDRDTLEFHIVAPEGVRRRMETHAAPLRTSDGSTVQLAVARDITERKRAEETLQQNEKRYRDFLESASVALHFVGPDGIILWANQAELDLLGYTADEYIGRHIADFHVDAPIIGDILDRLCRGERLREYEARLRAKDGSIRHVLIDSSVLFEDGKFIHTRCFTRNITERKRAEQALRESEQRFRVITDASPIMVWMSGTDKLCYYFNKTWLDFVGRTLEQEVGNGWAENVHPEDFDRCLQIYVANFDARRPFEMEYRLRHRSGQYRWITDHGVPRFALDGTFEGYVGGCLDVHDQKEAAEVRNRLAAIVESSDDAIVGKDLNSIVTSWNRGAERIFGYTAAEMIGQSITRIIPPELQGDEHRILQTIARGDRIDHFETVRLTKSGERIDVSLTISPVKDDSGRIIGAAKIARDITQRKNSERALHTTERLASVGRLAATVAHEINNPLEAVTNLVYLAKCATVRADVHDYLAAAEEELERVSHLTRQTLGFYRETKGVAPIRIGSAVTSLLSVFATRARNKGIEIVPEVIGDPEIYAIPGEIRQLIANLMTNSIDAVNVGGKVRIRVSEAKRGDRSGVQLTIADNGIGIPTDVRPHLFEPFFTTKKEVGTGLGLWVCKNIVDQHHGTIRVRSTTNKACSGTIFSIFLPANVHATATESLRQAV
jgi:PAS domain S-box-containing protein